MHEVSEEISENVCGLNLRRKSYVENLWAKTCIGRMDFPRAQVLTGDMLLAAAFVSYAGPFTSALRASLINDWIKFLTDKGAPMTPGISDPLKVGLFCDSSFSRSVPGLVCRVSSQIGEQGRNSRGFCAELQL